MRKRCMAGRRPHHARQPLVYTRPPVPPAHLLGRVAQHQRDVLLLELVQEGVQEVNARGVNVCSSQAEGRR